ncbi:P-loop containing nucleoside triphosphate hydrolase protein [Phascolomyces articulosus]|uniref:P-loop containing nucleoside triphosphate hydrolase protein n=1 Tax=Phascolomyces articulosus TaxID=60185 RepID=A0AAD5KGJ1_9FUNG|nr:P-loop containing nucleoside triphosphate hydrolase protein [Phascolomyces articulosus]
MNQSELYFEIYDEAYITIYVVQPNPRIKDTLNRICEHQADNTWVFQRSREVYNQVLKYLLDTFSKDVSTTIHRLPEQVAKAVLDHPNRVMNRYESELLEEFQSKELWHKLKDYQQVGVREALKRKGRILLADEMGVGKTLQAIAISTVYKQYLVLVICPRTVLPVWGQELIRWLDLKSDQVEVCGTSKEIRSTMNNLYGNPDPLYIVTTYDLFANNAALLDNRFNFIILDESQKIKNDSTCRATLTMPVIAKSRYLVLLSGTPVFANPFELFSQVSLLSPEYFLSIGLFTKRYYIAENTTQYQTNSDRLLELHLLLKETVMFRHLKEDIDSISLPLKTRAVIPLELYNIDRNKLIVQNDLFKEEWLQTGHYHSWYGHSAELKIPYIIDCINNLINNQYKDKKFIIYCYHDKMMHSIQDFLVDIGVYGVSIAGDTTLKQREEFSDYFQKNDHCRIMLMKIDVAVGITLTAADIVIFMQLFWTPASIMQAEDRAHRIGRESPVKVLYLLSKHTIDETMFSVIQRKVKIVERILDGGDGIKFN